MIKPHNVAAHISLMEERRTSHFCKTWSKSRPDNTVRHFFEKQRHGNSRSLCCMTGYSCIRSVTGVLDSHATATLLEPFSVSLSSFASWNTDHTVPLLFRPSPRIIIPFAKGTPRKLLNGRSTIP